MKTQLTAKYTKLKRNHKKWIMVFGDVLILALWSAWALRLGGFWPQPYLNDFWWLFPAVIPIVIFIFAKFVLYRAIIRYIGSQALFVIVRSC